jgi:hypothetical protein
MANGNFVVQNGLQVGPLTIDAATGAITTTGNITTTGTTTTFINEVVTGTEAVYGILTANSGTTSTSTTTGAFQVVGGAGITGNVYIGGITNHTGNVAFDGPLVTHYDSVIDIHTYGNLAAWSTDDGKDIGLRFHYYKGVDTIAFLGWENTTQTLQYLQSATETNSNVSGTFGNVQFGSLLLSNSTASSSTTTGALVVTGGAGVGGALYNSGVHVSSGNVVAASGTASTSATTGALVVTGGVGISGNVFTSGWIVPTSNVSQNLGSTTSWWNIFYGKSTQAQYADLAENYQADAAYQAGQVVEFGGTYEVTLATPDTKRVAGVVSTNPAHLMNGGLQGSNVIPLALQGRVPCNVIGPVTKGDLMVSAGFGYAKPNNNAQVGQVIGKALADFSGAKGVIEVVVGRQ